MEIEEALRINKDNLSYWKLIVYNYPESKKFKDNVVALKMAIEVLEKQEPQLIKGIRSYDSFDRTLLKGACPVCDTHLNNMDYTNYCEECGQAIKWDDED